MKSNIKSATQVKLEHLRRVGFRRELILDESGQPAFDYFTRTWGEWREAIIVRGEHEAHAYRYRPSAHADTATIDPTAGDRFIPPGDVVTVANALLSLSEQSGDKDNPSQPDEHEAQS